MIITSKTAINAPSLLDPISTSNCIPRCRGLFPANGLHFSVRRKAPKSREENFWHRNWNFSCEIYRQIQKRLEPNFLWIILAVMQFGWVMDRMMARQTNSHAGLLWHLTGWQQKSEVNFKHNWLFVESSDRLLDHHDCGFLRDSNEVLWIHYCYEPKTS